MLDTLLLRLSLYFTPNYTSLHFLTLHFFPFKLHPATLQYPLIWLNPISISHHSISPHITILHLISLHYTSPHFTSLLDDFLPHLSSLHFTPFIIPFLTLFLKILGLQRKVPNVSAGSQYMYIYCAHFVLRHFNYSHRD